MTDSPELVGADGWQRSSHTDGVQCAQVKAMGDRVALRDDTDPDRVVLMTRGSFRAFLQGARAGEFDHLAG